MEGRQGVPHGNEGELTFSQLNPMFDHAKLPSNVSDTSGSVQPKPREANRVIRAREGIAREMELQKIQEEIEETWEKKDAFESIVFDGGSYKLHEEDEYEEECEFRCGGVSPDERFVVAGDNNGTIHYWDMSLGKYGKKRTLKIGKFSVQCLVFRVGCVYVGTHKVRRRES